MYLILRYSTDLTEAVDIDFDPTQISFSQLLDLFWNSHDPYQQMEPEYMSVICYHDDQQKKESYLSMEKTNGRNQIFTKIVAAGEFFEAKQYVFNYLEYNNFKQLF